MAAEDWLAAYSTSSGGHGEPPDQQGRSVHGKVRGGHRAFGPNEAVHLGSRARQAAFRASRGFDSLEGGVAAPTALFEQPSFAATDEDAELEFVLAESYALSNEGGGIAMMGDDGAGFSADHSAGVFVRSVIDNLCRRASAPGEAEAAFMAHRAKPAAGARVPANLPVSHQSECRCVCSLRRSLLTSTPPCALHSC